MKRIVMPVASVVTGLWLSTASALGLGEIQVRSNLNQRFDAVIPLEVASVEEASTLRVGLASADEFARAGIEHGDYLASLRFAVRTDGAPRIEIRSEQIAREPYVQLLLDIRSGGSRILRQYTVLLDPPEFSAAESATRRSTKPKPIVDAEPARPVPVPLESAPPPQVTAPAPAASAPAPKAAPPPAEPLSAEAGALYGPVKPAETLWSIATRMRPGPDVTMDQVLLAIYRQNPAAFDGGINGLLKGAMLRVPSAADMTAVSALDAKAEVTRLRNPRAAAPRGATPPAKPRRPKLEPANITPPPAPTVTEAQPPVSETPPPAETPAPAPAPSEAATPPVETADATTSAPEGAVAESPAETPVETTPELASEEAPVAKPKPAPVRTPPRGEGGLFETLLLPLILGLLALFGIAYLYSRWKQRRAAAAATPPPAPPAATDKPRRAPPTPPSASKMAAAAGVAGAAAAEGAGKAPVKPEPQRFEETLEATASVTQQLQTQAMEVEPPTSEPAAADTAALPEVDFDLTGQFAAQTVQIDLDANDPVSEADFHLAYGLYDEAALLLTQAAAKEPARTDIAVKLAETYFAAGKVAEFEQTAAELKDKLSPAEWQKLAIMGQQLAPSSSLFSDAGGAPLETDIDLGFETPALDAPELSAAPAADFAPPVEPAPTQPDATLDFKLEDLELPSLDPVQSDQPAERGDALDFDLGDFDMGESPTPAAPAASTPPPAADPGEKLDFDLGDFQIDEPLKPAAPEVAADPGNTLDFDLSGFDIDPPPAASTPAPAVEATTDIRLDEFDFDIEPPEATEISGDEAGTKLDLARAYVDMGDNEMARGLLNEVLQQGNEAQQRDARDLLGRLG